MSKRTDLFSNEQLRFIARKAISKYNLAIVEGKIGIRDGTKYKLFGFEKDKPYFEEDTTKDFSNIPIIQLKETGNIYDGIANEIHGNWVALKGEFEYSIQLESEPDAQIKYYNFLLHAIKPEHKTKSADIISAAICYVLVDYIKKDEITLKSTQGKLLINLKILLKKTFTGFPNDVELENKPLEIPKYNIIVIGDKQSKENYKQIASELEKSDKGNSIRPRHWNISNPQIPGEFYLEKLGRTKDEKLIGVLIYLTNEVGEKIIKRENESGEKLLDIILEWSRSDEYRIVPITYVKVGKVRKEYLDKLKELGEPSEDDLGILRLFIKAIQRYKEKDEEYKLILNENIELKDTIGNKEKSNQRLKKIASLLLVVTLASILLFFIKSYDPYLIKPYVIDLNDECEPYYLEIDTTQNFLYVSNNNQENKNNTYTYFYRFHLDDLKNRVRVNSQKTSFDFKFIDNVVLFTSNESGTLEIGEITTDDDTDKADFVQKKSINSNSDSIKYSDAIAISPNKKNIVVTNWTSNDILIITDFNSKNPSEFDHKILSINRLRSSGAAFVNDSICIISLHENVSQKLLAVDIARDTVYEIKWGTVSHHALDDVKFTGEHIITCSKKEIYRLKIDDLMTEIYGQNKQGAKPDYNGRIKHDGSTTHISISTNQGDKYAVLSHESHNYVTIVDVDGSFGTKKIKFSKGDDPIDCSGIVVDWRDMSAPVAFIPNSHENGSKKIYSIKLPDPRKLKYDTPEKKTSK